MISLIVAVAEHGVIGDRNALLWHISEDLRHFKAVTTGHPVVMGRKTWGLGIGIFDEPSAEQEDKSALMKKFLESVSRWDDYTTASRLSLIHI